MNLIPLRLYSYWLIGMQSMDPLIVLHNRSIAPMGVLVIEAFLDNQSYLEPARIFTCSPWKVCTNTDSHAHLLHNFLPFFFFYSSSFIDSILLLCFAGMAWCAEYSHHSSCLNIKYIFLLFWGSICREWSILSQTKDPYLMFHWGLQLFFKWENHFINSTGAVYRI